MRRKIYDKLLEWKKQNGTSARVVQGARRVGKSHIVEVFAKKEYKSYILIDFNKADLQIKDIFKYDLDNLNSFFMKLSAYYGENYMKENLLSFLTKSNYTPEQEAQ